MRITLVCPFDPLTPPGADFNGHVGGVERVYAEIGHRLAHRGHDVTLVCSTDGTPGESIEGGIRVIRKTRRFVVMRTPVCRLARGLAREADVIQVAGTYPFTTASVLSQARRMGVPGLLDFHFEPRPTGPGGRAAAAAYRSIAKGAYESATSVLVRSMAYGRAAPSLAGIPESKWRVVPNGIDPEHFRPGAPGPGGYLLYIGRLVPYKGLQVLLKACARAGLKIPLVIAGEGPMRYRLQSMARDLGVDARFLGRVSDDALPGLYAGARLTVLPSTTMQESFGIVLIESMACGTPVLASDLPGVSELAGMGGLTAPPGAVDVWADRIKQAIEPWGLPRGPELAAPVRASHSWEAVVDRLEAVYEEVAGQGGTRAGHGGTRDTAGDQGEVMQVAHPGRRSVL